MPRKPADKRDNYADSAQDVLGCPLIGCEAVAYDEIRKAPLLRRALGFQLRKPFLWCVARPHMNSII